MQNITNYYESLSTLLKKHFDVNVYVNDIADLKKDSFIINTISYTANMFGDGTKFISIDTDLMFFKVDKKEKSKKKQVNKLDLFKVQDKISNILSLGFYVGERHYKVKDLNFKIIDDILHCTFFSEIKMTEIEYLGDEYFSRKEPSKEDEQGSNEIIDENMRDLKNDKKYKYMKNLYISKEK